MKKTVARLSKIGFLIMCVLFISTSCTKEYYDQYYHDTYIYTEDFNMLQNDWLWDATGGSYFYEFDYEKITPQDVENGTIQVAAYIDGSYRPLPYTRYFFENGKEYAETVNFEYNTNFIRFNVIALDQFNDIPSTYKPETFSFRVTIISYL